MLSVELFEEHACAIMKALVETAVAELRGLLVGQRAAAVAAAARQHCAPAAQEEVKREEEERREVTPPEERHQPHMALTVTHCCTVAEQRWIDIFLPFKLGNTWRYQRRCRFNPKS